MNILIVDDNMMNIRIAEDALREFQVNGEIYSRQSGEEAIEFVEQNPVDLILLDIVMPGITGLDFLILISEKGYLNKFKIVMLTGVDDLEILKQCFELGATDYIHKPFNKVEFAVRVKAALAEAENEKKLKKALELLELQNLELKRINQTLKETQTYIVEKERMMAVGSLLYGLTQEIEIPLANLENLIAAESRMKIDASTLSLNHPLRFQNEIYKSELIYNAEKEIVKIRKIIATLEELSTEDKQVKFAYVKISDLVDEVLVLMASELKNITRITRYYHDTDEIYCNRTTFKQALVHIIVNAIYALREVAKSEITIRTLEADETIILTVEDNGEGLSKDALSNAFSPFFTTKPREQFMGLGLSIVHDIIVKNHAGKVEMDCFNGKTRVTITMNKKE
ncbi:hybrid sensor histidine kinase/response regulator [Fusibacter bizertensis]